MCVNHDRLSLSLQDIYRIFNLDRVPDRRQYLKRNPEPLENYKTVLKCCFYESG